VVIGPKDLARGFMRFVGQWVGKARGMARHFPVPVFDEMVRQAELEEMEKKWAAEKRAQLLLKHPPEAHEITTVTETVGEEKATVLLMNEDIDEKSRAVIRSSAGITPPAIMVDPPRSRLHSGSACILRGRSLPFLFSRSWRAGQGKIIYTQIFEAFFVEIQGSLSFAALMLAFPRDCQSALAVSSPPASIVMRKRALLPFILGYAGAVPLGRGAGLII